MGGAGPRGACCEKKRKQRQTAAGVGCPFRLGLPGPHSSPARAICSARPVETGRPVSFSWEGSWGSGSLTTFRNLQHKKKEKHSLARKALGRGRAFCAPGRRHRPPGAAGGAPEHGLPRAQGTTDEEFSPFAPKLSFRGAARRMAAPGHPAHPSKKLSLRERRPASQNGAGSGGRFSPTGGSPRPSVKWTVFAKGKLVLC